MRAIFFLLLLAIPSLGSGGGSSSGGGGGGGGGFTDVEGSPVTAPLTNINSGLGWFSEDGAGNLNLGIPAADPDASFGLMTNGSQTIGGSKHFANDVYFNLLTTNTVPYISGLHKLQSSAVTTTELGYLSGVTSSIQTQLSAAGDFKADGSVAMTGQLSAGNGLSVGFSDHPVANPGVSAGALGVGSGLTLGGAYGVVGVGNALFTDAAGFGILLGGYNIHVGYDNGCLIWGREMDLRGNGLYGGGGCEFSFNYGNQNHWNKEGVMLLGHGLDAQGMTQIVMGRFNVVHSYSATGVSQDSGYSWATPPSGSAKAFVFGNGASGSSRSDAFTADFDSNFYVGGGLKLHDDSTRSQPTCGSSYRGMMWLIQGAAGVADTFQVCMKDAADAYAWVTK